MSSVSRTSTRSNKGAWGGQSNSIHALINFKQSASSSRGSSMMQSRASGISADSDDDFSSRSSVSRSYNSSMSDFSNSSRISTSMYHPSELSTGSQSYKGKSHGGAAAFYRQHMLDNIKDWSVPRMICYDLLEANWFSSFIFVVILANTVIIAIQTDLKIQINGGWYFTLIDNLFLAIYTFELFLKLYVWRMAFFKSGWNCFDFVIVVVSYGDFMWTQLVGSLTKFNPRVLRLLRILRVLRALRALRVLRTITFFNSLQVMVVTLLRSAPAWANIGLLLMLTLYIFAIMGQNLYGGISARFSSLSESMFTMFQLITLDNWSQINDDAKNKPGGQTMILFLITYIIIQTLIFVNLFVAVIVNNLEEVQKRSYERIKQEMAKQDRRNRGHRSHTESAADLSRVALGYDDKVDLGGGGPGNMGNMDKYLNASSANQRKKQSMAYSLMLLAAVENNLESFHQQQRTLDDLVDIAN